MFFVFVTLISSLECFSRLLTFKQIIFSDLTNYAKSAEYGKMMKICEGMINKYSVSVELKEHWLEIRMCWEQ